MLTKIHGPLICIPQKKTSCNLFEVQAAPLSNIMDKVISILWVFL